MMGRSSRGHRAALAELAEPPGLHRHELGPGTARERPACGDERDSASACDRDDRLGDAAYVVATPTPASRRPAGSRPSSPRTESRASSGRLSGSKAAATRETPSRCQRRSRGGTPRRKTGRPDPSPADEWMHPGIGRAPTDKLVFSYDQPTTKRLAGERDQRGTRRAERTRPLAACCSDHAVISERSQSLTRPLPRSNTGLGMSPYRCWYWSTVFR
jgi:hypothetical protein